MHVVISVFGSRGDVQPALALAVGMQRAGHSVLMTAPPNFESWIRSYGVPCRGIGRDSESVLREAGMSVAKALRIIRQEADQQFVDHEELVKGADLIVGAGVHCAGRSFAELQGIPYIFVSYAPQLFRSSAHPNPLFDLGLVPRWAHGLSWKGASIIFNALFRKSINAQRASRGLKPIDDVWDHLVASPVLFAAETALSPLPPDTQAGITTTGAWVLEDNTPVDAETDAFIREGAPPVYIGFGSMPDGQAEATSRRIADAVEMAGVRALVSAGWARLGAARLPPSIRLIGPTSHGQLFPRVTAVVHHGGAGTTAAAARAGVPQVIVPHGYDQFHWGQRTQALGLSPPLIPKTRLTAARLAEALRVVTSDAAMRERAASFASRLTTDGVQRAIAHLESVVRDHRAGRLALAG